MNGKMTLSSFIYSYNMNVFRAKRHMFGTCWANACAACIYLRLISIVGRKEESFQSIRNHLLVNYSLDDKDGNSCRKVLEKVVGKYGLHMKQLYTDEEAINAVKKGIPCVATFSLSGNQWENFGDFFQDDRTRKQCLTEEKINEKNKKKEMLEVMQSY